MSPQTPPLPFPCRPWAGFFLLLAVFASIMLYRATRESSLWIDEVYSIQMIQKDIPGIIDATSIDSHPPFYYLLLNAWESGFASLWPGAGIIRVRSFNLLWGVILLAIVWAGCRALAGERRGPVIAWCIAAGPGTLQMIKETRSYAMAAASLAACFFLLLILQRNGRDGQLHRRKAAVAWSGYAIAAAIALWSHFLSAFALTAMGFLWIFFSLRHRPHFRHFILFGGIAQLAAALSAIPFIYTITHQVRHVAGQGHWSTRATVWNLYQVFAYWYPFGNLDAAPAMRLVLVLFGTMTFAIPLLVFCILRTRKLIRMDSACLAAGAGLAVCVLYNISLWGIERATGFQLFMGSRYSLLVQPMWLFGLAAIAIAVAQQRCWNTAKSAFLLAPIFISAIVGHFFILRSENNRGLKQWLENDASAYLPAPNEALFVYPEELLPYFKNSLADHAVLPIGELLNLPPSRRNATVLNLSFWENMLPPRDLLFRELMFDNVLAEQHLTFDGREYELHRLVNLRHEALNDLSKTGFLPREDRIPHHAVSSARPADQMQRRGWSLLEPEIDREFFRWSTSARTPIEFREPVPPGRYLLRLQGARPNVASARGEMIFQFEGEEELPRIDPEPGEFDLEIAVTFAKPGRPVLWVAHPVWTQDQAGTRPGDMRPYSFLFRAAWLEQRPEGLQKP